MNEETNTNDNSDASRSEAVATRHPKITKPPYYHKDTKTHQEEVGRFGHKRVVRHTLWFTRFVDNHNGLVTAIATGFIAAFTFFLAHDSSRQADIIDRQLQLTMLEERPWIAIEGIPSINGLFDIGKDGVATTFVNFTVANIGKTPAYRVHAYGRIVDLMKITDIFTVQKRICDETSIDEAPAGSHFIENTMLPQQKFITNVFVAGDILLKKTNTISMINFLVGCVAYTELNTKIHHKTGFLYNIDQTPPYRALNVGDRFDASVLHLTWNEQGSGPAD